KTGHVKCILQFSLDNEWNELDHVRVQPPTSLDLEVKPRMLNVEKNNNSLSISVVSIIAQAQSHLTRQLIEKLYKLVQDVRRIIIMDNDLTDLNIEWIKALRKGRILIWCDDHVIFVSPKNHKTGTIFFCGLVSSVSFAVSSVLAENCGFKTETKPNRPLASLITKEGVFQWLLNAKRECLSRELQNRGIFSDIDSIIQNKDVPSVRLWVAYMLEKYCSQHLFDWRMVDFLRKAGMEVLIIKTAPKSKENTLLQVVKVKCFMVKAEEISEIS
ncbi:hypothetical protein RclHR1_33640001, partial [Rhizophagus clarus]